MLFVLFRADTDASDGVQDKVVRPKVNGAFSVVRLATLCAEGSEGSADPCIECSVLDGRELWLAIWS